MQSANFVCSALAALSSRSSDELDVSSRDSVLYQRKSHSRSCCADFAYWVIDQAGLPLPEQSRRDPITQSNSTSRFLTAYSSTSNPKPGDLYHMPYKGTKAVWHIGFVVDAENYEQILIIHSTEIPILEDIGHLAPAVAGFA